MTKGSEPSASSPSKRDSAGSNNLLQISITPPPLLEHVNASQQSSPQPEGQTSSPLSRSESLRLLNTASSLSSSQHDNADGTLKKAKRTPSFTTRRRTASFRNKNKKHPENLPPVEIEGYLERKHELQAGGKRAAVRSWKHYYVLLCGQLLCFFKDQEDFEMSKVGSSSPITVYLAKCEVATDYTKRKYVFRVKPTDGSEFLFAADNKESMDAWVKKINFHASLDPKNQLDMMEQQKIAAAAAAAATTTNDESSRVMMPPPPPPPKRQPYDSTSTDEDEDHSLHRKPKPRNNVLQQPRSREPIYANHHEDALASEQARSVSAAAAAKPPIPPRSSSIVTGEPQPAAAANGRSPMKNGSSDTIDNQQYFTAQQQRPVSVDRIHHRYSSYNNGNSDNSWYPAPAPLPRSNPSPLIINQQQSTFKPQPNNRFHHQQQQYHQYSRGSLSRDLIPITVVSSISSANSSSFYHRGPTSPQTQVVTSSQGLHQLSPRSSGSLPPGMTLSGSPNSSFLHNQQQQQQHHHHHLGGGDFNSSSENEQGFHSSSPSPHGPSSIQQTEPVHGDTGSSSKKGNKKSSKRDSTLSTGSSGGGGDTKESGSGLMGLFRRKKATQL